MAKIKSTGAKALLESLRREGVEIIFGYPGGAVIPLYDEIYHCDFLQHVLVRHEQGGGHMAERHDDQREVEVLVYRTQRLAERGVLAGDPHGDGGACRSETGAGNAQVVCRLDALGSLEWSEFGRLRDGRFAGRGGANFLEQRRPEDHDAHLPLHCLPLSLHAGFEDVPLSLRCLAHLDELLRRRRIGLRAQALQRRRAVCACALRQVCLR